MRVDAKSSFFADVVTCCGCQNVFGGSDKWLSHLRFAKSDGCWPSLWIKFLTDCDAEGDDNAARLLILTILGRVETLSYGYVFLFLFFCFVFV